MNVFGQTLTNDDYAKLVRSFAKDVQLMGDSRENYENYIATHPSSQFSHLRVLSLNSSQHINRNVEKVVIIVKSSIYNQLAEKIDRYAIDIHNVYGCEVIMEMVSGGNHRDIKDLIVSHQTNLNGAVFIGDIPVAWFEIDDDFGGYGGGPGYGYAVWPCDLYYMSLNGTWSDTDENGIYDSHTGDINPNIFVGRISTANMGLLLSEKEGLEKYFDKNHNFWIGKTLVKKKFGLTYTDQDWVVFDDMRTDIKYLYGNSYYDQIGYGNPIFGKTDYLNRLKNNRYEFIQLACHANHEFLQMSGGNILANEIYYNGSEAIGVNLFSCSACNWTAVQPNSYQGFLGGVHAYNNNNSSLVVVGSTKTGSMLNFDKFYLPLGEGKTIGEALKQWWIDAYGNNHNGDVISWHYGMSIIGDPLVNFLYQCFPTWEIGTPVADDVIATFSEGTLSITGIGAMKSWMSQEDIPWYSIKDEIINVVIDENVTTIGDFAFTNCQYLLSTNIPSSLSDIGSSAFLNCSRLSEIHSQNPTPPNFGDYCFEGVNQADCILHVPEGNLCTYFAAPIWQDFNIDGLPFTITITVGTGGSSSQDGVTVNCGDNITICFSPNAGYEIDEVWIDGILNPQAIFEGCLTFVNISSNHIVVITFKLIDAIHDDVENTISIFPTPAYNEIFIKSKLQINKVELYSLTGTLLLSDNNFPEKIVVSTLSKGIYLLNIFTDKGLFVRKFEKK